MLAQMFAWHTLGTLILEPCGAVWGAMCERKAVNLMANSAQIDINNENEAAHLGWMLLSAFNAYVKEAQSFDARISDMPQDDASIAALKTNVRAKDFLDGVEVSRVSLGCVHD